MIRQSASEPAMCVLQTAIGFVKLAVLDQLGAQLGLPPHADRAPMVEALMTLLLCTVRQAGG
jgi:hypothetical protein